MLVGKLCACDLTAKEIVVDQATILKPTKASWAKVRFNTASAMQERECFFAKASTAWAFGIRILKSGLPLLMKTAHWRVSTPSRLKLSWQVWCSAFWERAACQEG